MLDRGVFRNTWPFAQTGGSRDSRFCIFTVREMGAQKKIAVNVFSDAVFFSSRLLMVMAELAKGNGLGLLFLGLQFESQLWESFFNLVITRS